VIERLDLEPKRIAFFDDLDENVSSARQVGMNAFITKGLPELRGCLDRLWMLSYSV
jgi:FMN phosphatase YigB (HAD superfamily)